MSRDNNKVESQILEQVSGEGVDGTFTTGSGIKFKLKKVSKMLTVEAVKKLEYPKVPTVYIQEKGREEPNYDDPDYREQREDVDFRRGMLSAQINLALGTELVDLPEELQHYDSDDWVEMVNEAGVSVPETKRGRYVAWLKFYALSDEDLALLVKAVMRYSGYTMTEDVSNAEANFRPD